ncbi:MAG: hypothetical protein HGGPFJEG_03018 [Ignavibacteria bacterium]|nr:hypothetical protein [Ignavibacteria bacterium]
MKYFLLSFLFLLHFADGIAQHRYKTKRDPTKYNERSADVKIFRAFNNIESSFINSLINITNESINPVSIAAPAGMYIAARINDNHYDESSSILLLLSEITNVSVTQGLKFLIKRDRPFRTLNNVKLSDTNSVTGSYSFPSGHSSESFTIATSLTLRYPDNAFLIAGLYTYATVVSLGRIYWGVHYPSDVFAGMLIGAGCSALIFSLRKPIIEAKNDLFNQSERTDSFSGGINTSVFLASVIAADLINSFFVNSSKPVLKKSKVDFSFNGVSGNLNYTLNF